MLEKEIGAGGMARIYSAEDPALARSVAVKLPHVPAEGGRARLAQVSDRMSIEALALAKVRHPQVLQIHDFDRGHWDEGRWNRPPYLVTERVPGGSLIEYAAEHGRFRPEVVALIGVSLGRSLFAVHAQGIVHRDVKPANVLVDLENPGRLVLSDFGTACFPGAGLALTGKDELPGTLGYMAPEQLLRRKVDDRADVFALGVTLYELVAGRRPFVAEGREALLAEIRRGRYDRLSALVLRVPPYLEAVIDRCLQSRPGRRWLSVGYVVRALEEGLASEGMDCVGRELERCFVNPRRYVADLDGRLVDVGLLWAENALRQGLPGVARVWCERVLTIE
ncbi:MAG TPA: serine/threonine-protein kinase, partial [Polyangia bacterium]|nr:serine/threonine-protein kinase [Polyangia bacterium]